MRERRKLIRARERKEIRMKKKMKYSKDLPRQMYSFFTSFVTGGVTKEGAPSFSKFARSIGVTLEEVEHFRRDKEFDRAYRECSEIRKDYLIDSALNKRFDPSFVKYLLTEDADNALVDDGIAITLNILDADSGRGRSGGDGGEDNLGEDNLGGKGCVGGGCAESDGGCGISGGGENSEA